MKLLELAPDQAILQSPNSLALIQVLPDASKRLVRTDLLDVLRPVWAADPNPTIWYILKEPRLPYSLGGLG